MRGRTGQAAEGGGVKEGDLILEVNRKPVTSLKTYERLAAALLKGRTVLPLMKRQGRTVFLTVRP